MSRLWLGTWWDVYGEKRQWRPVRMGGAVWPLYQEHRRGLRHLALAGHEYTRHSLPVAEAIPALATQLGELRDWDELNFTGLPLSRAGRWREEFEAAGVSSTVSAPWRQRYFPLDRPWREIEADCRPGLLRNIEKRERALRKLGPAQLRIQRQTGGLNEVFDACLAIEASGWKGRQGTAIQSRPDAERFYRTLAHRAAEAGALHLALLYMGDTLIAFSFDLCIGRVLAGVKVGYLDSWRRYAPGMVLKYRLLRQLHTDRMVEFDLAGGDDPYKAEWTPHARTLAGVHAFNRTARGRAAALLNRSRSMWRAVGARWQPATPAPPA